MRIEIDAPVGVAGSARAPASAIGLRGAPPLGSCRDASPAPRSSAGATVRYGLSEVIGSWKIIDDAARRAAG